VKLANITSLVSFLFDILFHEPEAIERRSIKIKKKYFFLYLTFIPRL